MGVTVVGFGNEAGGVGFRKGLGGWVDSGWSVYACLDISLRTSDVRGKIFTSCSVLSET